MRLLCSPEVAQPSPASWELWKGNYLENNWSKMGPTGSEDRGVLYLQVDLCLAWSIGIRYVPAYFMLGISSA